MRFTTRPELRGTFGMVASTHWLASQSGMAVLERGGNAFDAAVAAGFVLQVVEPHLNGPGGEVVALLYAAERDEVRVALRPGRRARGGDDRPLPRSRPRARSRHGCPRRLRPGRLRRVAPAPARLRDMAARGRPRARDRLRGARLPRRGPDPRDRRAGPRAARGLAGLARAVPAAARGRKLFRNPALAATYRRIVDESRGGSREDELERARRLFYEGFVAEEIDRFVAGEGGFLSADDLAGWEATLEPAVSLEYGGLVVCKTGAWGTGPAALQQLALLRGFDLAELSEAELVHVVTECAKLAFADRDALYGDDADVRLDILLSEEYNAERRALVGEEASGEQRPGYGRLPRLHDAVATAGSGEPSQGTVHLDVADRFGNMVSATPSGGWLQSSPVIPALGWPLGTRAQMLWLEEGLPSSLRPGARPRITLSPGLALRDDGRPYLAWGTPGGDQQEQWALHVFLRHVDLGLDLQSAIDAPEFHTDHLVSSFHPRGFEPRSLALEARFGARTIADLQQRGHDVTLHPPWSLGRVTAVAREPDGLLKAAANPRGMQGYAVGR